MESCMLLLTLACSVLHLTSSLTDSEIAKFTNKGCVTPAGNVTITKSTDGTSLTIYSNGVPDHVWGSCNPNKVTAHTITFTVPTSPVAGSTYYCVPPSIVGVSINGVSMYNPLTSEGKNAVEGTTAETFDVCGGHPDTSGRYHYYRLPSTCGLYDTGTRADQLMGVAIDGFPIYGPYQADLARDAVAADLDVCHGRTANGAYRYVYLGAGSTNFPYIVGCFRAQPMVADFIYNTCSSPSATKLCSCNFGTKTYSDVTTSGTVTSTVCPVVAASETCGATALSTTSIFVILSVALILVMYNFKM